MKYNNEPYLRHEHLLIGGKYLTQNLKIEGVMSDCPTRKNVGGKEVTVNSYGVKFSGYSKELGHLAGYVLGLCKSNCSLIAVSVGDSRPTEWIGKTVEIQTRRITGKDGEQLAIRIVPPVGTPMRSGLRRQLGEKI